MERKVLDSPIANAIELLFLGIDTAIAIACPTATVIIAVG
jgi:hypothetical protein